MNPLAQELLDLGWKPKRQFGQNFLFDAHFLDLMVREADLRADDVVVEFGTGPGQLTERLAQKSALVFTIDIDPQLHKFAKGRVTLPNIEFLQADAIPGGDTLAPELVERVTARLEGRRLRVVSNFPYAVGGSILLALAERQLPAFDSIGTLQDEVADRLTAVAGEDAYGPLGILIGRLATTKKIRDVAPQLFWPMPQVYSALVRVEFGAGSFEGNWAGYKAFVKSVFSQRRKMLSSGLRRLGFRYAGEHASMRPEALTPAQLETVWREARPFADPAVGS